MVQLATDESSLRILIERLCWPVRLVRWRVAQEYGALLASKKHASLAQAIYLDWLSHRQLESEVVSGLSVLKCVPNSALPSIGKLCAAINAPSVLADLLLQSVYGYGYRRGGWANAHSGTAPASFQPSKFFLKYEGSHIPPIFGDLLRHLHEEAGLDFPKQWAFEWQTVMDKTKSTHSGYPHYFIDSVYRETGVSGQFSQRQDDVYRSAFLRTIAWGVSTRMPIGYANDLAAHSLTLNNDFANLKAIARPDWLGSLPEDCCARGADFSVICKRLISTGRTATKTIPISIKVPISPEAQKFADLQITGVLASTDFKWEKPDLSRVHRKFWNLGESSSFDHSLPKDDADDCAFDGERGTCLPIALNIWPFPAGFCTMIILASALLCLCPMCCRPSGASFAETIV